jgi:hypothetical protein
VTLCSWRNWILVALRNGYEGGRSEEALRNRRNLPVIFVHFLGSWSWDFTLPSRWICRATTRIGKRAQNHPAVLSNSRLLAMSETPPPALPSSHSHPKSAATQASKPAKALRSSSKPSSTANSSSTSPYSKTLYSQPCPHSPPSSWVCSWRVQSIRQARFDGGDYCGACCGFERYVA